MKVNGVYAGFIVKEKRHIDEVHSDAYVLEHQKSGARLLYLKNDDDNKVFSVSFRTPPADDTGLPHILEHSVLCGSRKYPLKEPFVELVKGSLNTFLNAMTFSDKTMYPIASRNDKDFRNLLDVYLDAVFYPNIYKNKYTLQQEGWHYEILSEDEPLAYKGVVYNEMKGVFSSPDALLEKHTMSALFPQSPYGFESGGFPDAIPQLTQEKFENFHKSYYHPANSYIFLYGDLNIKDTLAFIDEEYLSAFDKIEVASEINTQAMLPKTQKIEEFYPLANEESTEEKTFFDWSVVVGDVLNVEQSYAFQLLEHYLLETSASPLKKALVDAGVAKEVSGCLNNRIRQPVFSIRASGAKEENQDKFISTIYKTLQQISIEGVDKELLTASLNRMEFHLREADFGVYPKGLVYAISCMDSWLYDGDPTAYLHYNAVIKSLREKIDSRYYESLIENYLLDNTHRSVVMLIPKQGMQEEHQNDIDSKLAVIKEKMSTEEIELLIKNTKTLLSLQDQVDSPETLAQIPLLARSDIKREAQKFDHHVKEDGEITTLYLEKFTNKISYINMYFDAAGLPEELIPYGVLLKDILARIDTEKYSYSELSKAINMHTGGISFSLGSVADKEDVDIYSPIFTVSAKALVRNLEQLCDLLQSIITSSDFSDKKRLQELIAECKATWDAEFFARGQNIVIVRLLSYFSARGKYADKGQLEYYRFLDKLVKTDFEIIKENLEKTVAILFNKRGLFVSYCCEIEDKETVESCLMKIQAVLSDKEVQKQNYLFAPENKKEGIITSAQVQYVAMGGNFKKDGHAFTGAMRVLENIMRYDYLWNNIRVKGGAYGANAKFDYNGDSFFNSYRDPNLTETLQIFSEMPAYLEAFSADEREMTKYVIGTISIMDRPLTPYLELEFVAGNYLRGISYQTRQQERDEVIDCTKEDIQNLKIVLQDMLAHKYYCVLGGEGKIKTTQGVFDKTMNALQNK